MLLRAYNILMRVSTPVLRAYLKKRAAAGKEDVQRGAERRGQAAMPRPEGSLVWFHAASVGELLSIIPLAEKIEKKRDIKTILFTTNTLSSSKILHQKKNLKKTIHQFLPIDTNTFAKTFLDHWNPNLVFFIES